MARQLVNNEAKPERLPEDEVFEQLQAVLKEQGKSAGEMKQVAEAFDYGRKMHAGQLRKDKTNYIVHPMHVALILADIPVDTATIVAAILHDVLEDTEATPEEIEKRFGSEVLHLVEGVTKLGKFAFSSSEDRQAENFRRMFLAMAEDVRVVLLKLGDRLHNMRTLEFMDPSKQVKKASETLEIFAPLANRMGMGKLRAELEDLSLKYLHPPEYKKIESEIAHTQTERETTIQQVTTKIQDQLGQLAIEARIYGRVKNYYSIYKKMVTQQKSVQEIYDISALRIIVDSEKECYEALGIVHSVFTPIPGRFKDYIAIPKRNLYRSLHTTVIGPYGRPLEVQIRTQDMHRIAEYGIAAHWKYKEAGNSVESKDLLDQKFTLLRQMMEMQDEVGDAQEYVDSVKLDLFQEEVFVFTPKGRVIDMPRGSTPVDFAYRIHTEVGNTCSGAVVNGRIVPLNHKLQNGDIVEVITNKKNTPRLDWIKFVKTQQAKSRIRQWYKKNFREEHETQGKNLLEAELTRAIVDEALKSGKLLEVAQELNYSTVEDLYLALGYGEINLARVANRFKREQIADLTKVLPKQRLPKAKTGSSKSEIEGLKGMLYHLAKCCTPVPGEGIVAVVTRSRGVMVHREDCINLSHVNPARKMDVSWEGENRERSATYPVRLEIHVIDRVGVFKDVLTKIADTNTNLTNAKVKMLPDQTALIEVCVDIHDLEHLEYVKRTIRKVPEVVTVLRQQITTGKSGAGDGADFDEN